MDKGTPHVKIIRGIAWLVLVIQTVNLGNVLLHGGAGYGMGHGVGFDTFLAGIRDPWQNFINNDLVMGLLFSMAWLVFREQGAPILQIIAWVWMAAWWGNIAIAVYVLKAAHEAGRDWMVLLMGRHAPGSTMLPPWSPPAALRVLFAAVAVGMLIWLAYGLIACHFAVIPTIGYLAGFLPVVLSLGLLARHPAITR